MKEHEYNELLEASWQRPLTVAEEARIEEYLVAHPEHRDDWEQENALNQMLGDLPDAPLSSNFTARVMQATELEDARSNRKLTWFSRLKLPRLAWVPVIAALGFFAVQWSKNNVEARVQVMVEALPPDAEVVLADFDAIRVPVVEMDEELWLALSD